MDKLIKELNKILEPSVVDENTELSTIEEWDSLSVVSFVAMANSVFGKKVKTIDVNKATTIKDLYELVK